MQLSKPPVRGDKMQSETKKNVGDITEEQAIELLKMPRDYIFTGNELQFEDHILKYLSFICESLYLPPIKTIKRKFQIRAFTGKCMPDFLVIHTNETLSIFEAKCYRPSNGASDQIRAVGQCLYYQIAARERFGMDVPVFLIDWKILPETYTICSENNLHIGLVEIHKNSLFIPYCQYISSEVTNG